MAVWSGWLRIRTPANECSFSVSAQSSPAPVNPWSILLPAAAGVAGVGAWGAVHPTSQLFGPALCRTPRPSAVALTFDDGPNPAITPALLALLDRYEARATFFLVGRFARTYPELVREISERGHIIGNHTETHPGLAFLSTNRIEEELRRCQDSIAQGTKGAVPVWMRPPFGFRGPQLWTAVKRVGLHGVVLWSMTCYDWKPQPASQLIARLASIADRVAASAKTKNRNTTGGGEIVLLHEGDFRHTGADRRHVLSALEHWLPRWRDMGIEFVTVDEIAGAPSIG
jgi:peptidoglycan-N-acetylglucosamine deacetylase